MAFKLKSSFRPTGDQPQAIKKLSQGISNGTPHQVLLGVTGSGKTFSIANVIANVQKPTLVISHNKTLAAQLYQEFRDFFPQNAVSYFVSYYDYYQPEAYLPQTDTYIEKESDINQEIDRLRLQATTNLFTRKDVIVVASVSCIYNIGSPDNWSQNMVTINEGQTIDRRQLLREIVDLQYNRSDFDFRRGTFSVKGDTLRLWPAHLETAVHISFLDDTIEKITSIDPLTGRKIRNPRKASPRGRSKFEIRNSLTIYPAKHYLTHPSSYKSAFASINAELKTRLALFKKQGRELEAHRLNQKVNFDLEMIREVGYVNGIENYSSHFDGRHPGDPPYTLLNYFKKNTKDFLVIIDESHMSIPQINGMYRGDQSRKQTLIDFGFRLPSALDNRPLKFDEFLRRVPQAIYTSATPSDWELSHATKKNVTQQLLRPTGLVDPPVIIRPTQKQVADLIQEIGKTVKKKQRVLVTTLTKRMAEALTDHLKDRHIKVQYLHSDIETLDRSDILDDLRAGKYDVLVGINLLREGLDLPEVSLVAILDADKEGFLRSKTSLIQTMGRAARHSQSRVIMYADTKTRSIKAAVKEVTRRRQIQLDYNKAHNITPKTIDKPIRPKLLERLPKDTNPTPTVIQITKKEVVDLKTLDPQALTPQDKKRLIRGLTRKMISSARDLNFELATQLRDTIEKIKK